MSSSGLEDLRRAVCARRDVTTAHLSIRRNATWALGGNVGYAACQWGILAILTKTTTADDVGRFALGLAITAPIMIFASLLLRTIQATDATNQYSFGTYFGLRLITTLLAMLAIIAITIASGHRGSTLQLVFLIALAKAFETISDCVFGLLQKHENLRRIAISMLLKGALSLLAVALLVSLTRNVLAAAFAMAFTWGALLIGFDLPTAARLASVRPILASASVAKLARLALPMGIMAGLQSLMTNVPRYAVESSLGTAALGHFAALAYLLVAAYQPVMALWIAVSPRLARFFVADLAAYRELAERTVAIAAALGALTIVASALGGELLLRHAYAPEYAARAGVLTWLAVAAGFGYVASALGCAVTAARRLKEQALIAGVALAISAIASQFLVPRYGLEGAAWALLAASMAQALCLGTVYVSVCFASTELVGPAARADVPTTI